jgi:hypothetical protein
VAVLSVDLAHKRYADVGVCSLRTVDGHIEVEPIRLASLGMTGTPEAIALARTLAECATRLDARLLLIDGPQAWKGPENGLLHCRICERELATQGKTGLPGSTKPGSYVGFIRFAIELFDELGKLGWPRLDAESALNSSNCYALESFPTSAWRSLGLKPLPGKGRTRPGMIQAKLAELRLLLPLAISNADDLTHDELQALVSGLAGIAPEDPLHCSPVLSGVAPYLLDGHWREGFIVNPRRTARAM